MAESNQTLSLKEFQLHEKDTGSADVQVALLTRRTGKIILRVAACLRWSRNAGVCSII
jgi:hypothetical protein